MFNESLSNPHFESFQLRAILSSSKSHGGLLLLQHRLHRSLTIRQKIIQRILLQRSAARFIKPLTELCDFRLRTSTQSTLYSRRVENLNVRRDDWVKVAWLLKRGPIRRRSNKEPPILESNCFIP